jgi:hypothetical protein
MDNGDADHAQQHSSSQMDTLEATDTEEREEPDRAISVLNLVHL